MVFDFLNRDRKKKQKDELRENIDQIREKISQEDRREHSERERPSLRMDDVEADMDKRRRERQISHGPEDVREEPRRERRMETQDAEDMQGTPRPPERPSPRDGGDRRPRPPRPGPGLEGSSPEEDDYDAGSQMDEPDWASEDTGDMSSARDLPRSAEPARQRPSEQARAQNRGPQDVQGSSTGAGDGRSSISRDDVPQPPTVREIDVPSIEKGPLFITVDKFKTAVTELRAFQQQMEDLSEEVDRLDKSLETDRNAQHEMQEVLQRSSERARTLQDIVSP